MKQMMNKALHPAQMTAVEKLKPVRVGALYIDRQSGKFRTVSGLVRYRFDKGKIGGVLWLCTRRRRELISEKCRKYLADAAEKIRIVGLESMSHSLKIFLDALHFSQTTVTMLIIDNGLLIKNMKALRTQRVLELAGHCPYRLLISDMPFTRNIADMFSQWYALDARILGYRTLYGFSLNHVGPNGSARNVEYISRAIRPFSAQVLHEEVEPIGDRREYVFPFALSEEVRREYLSVVDRFLKRAFYSRTGVYRLLQACQLVLSGRRIVCDYPLKTESIYASDEGNARLQAFMEVAESLPDKAHILVFYKYRHEEHAIARALTARFCENAVSVYDRRDSAPTRFTLMNLMQDEYETMPLCADAVIYYSNDWNWQKRGEKEKRCLAGRDGAGLDIISLAAADTLEMKILKSVWRKENMVENMRRELGYGSEGRGRGCAKDLR